MTPPPNNLLPRTLSPKVCKARQGFRKFLSVEHAALVAIYRLESLVDRLEFVPEERSVPAHRRK